MSLRGSSPDTESLYARWMGYAGSYRSLKCLLSAGKADGGASHAVVQNTPAPRRVGWSILND
jgi:hypothetical protein